MFHNKKYFLRLVFFQLFSHCLRNLDNKNRMVLQISLKSGNCVMRDNVRLQCIKEFHLIKYSHKGHKTRFKRFKNEMLNYFIEIRNNFTTKLTYFT